jgi:hypothetical protein
LKSLGATSRVLHSSAIDAPRLPIVSRLRCQRAQRYPATVEVRSIPALALCTLGRVVDHVTRFDEHRPQLVGHGLGGTRSMFWFEACGAGPLHPWSQCWKTVWART